MTTRPTDQTERDSAWAIRRINRWVAQRSALINRWEPKPTPEWFGRWVP